MSQEIKNSIVVVTGGASGIGYEIVCNFLEKEAKKVIILDVNEDEGKKALELLSAKYGNNRAIFFKCDVAKDIDVIWKKLIDSYNKIDILVNNAGVGNETIPKIAIDINLTAVVQLSFKFWEANRKDKSGNGGTILNISSLYGVIVEQYLPVYHATKFGVVAFTRSLGHSFNYERSGVRVIAICPGFTRTQLVADLTNATWDERISKDYLKRSKEHSWQNVDAVGKATIEVFEKAESGTAWVIEGGNPIKEVIFSNSY
ncbi:unnamed protein product [Leptosia nina]|uniref:Alcohol dehydrogenase n=1 Tax=Leptosia nina TaxID=320188 RepID=A0AAV1JFW1_9NEOP